MPPMFIPVINSVKGAWHVRLLVTVSLATAPLSWADEKPETSLIDQARAAAEKGDVTGAMLLSGKALAEKKDAKTLKLHAQLCEASKHYEGQLEAYAELIKLEPEVPTWLNQSGVAKFMAGDFRGSVEDFDAFLEKVPSAMPRHWQRGLSQYGAGLFEEGRAQFEAHQKVNPNDVENAAWHFLCVASLEDVEAARKAIIPIRGDGRVPMPEVHDLFSGKGGEEAVLKAANAAAPQKRNHLCYAHLYLALYKEALGNTAEALKHYKLASVDYSMSHYMGETARVFYESRRKSER